MIDLFFNGGVLFMSILSLVLIAIFIGAIYLGFSLYGRKIKTPEKIIMVNNSIKSLSLFALVFGILGQLIGLFSAFGAVKIGSVEVSPAMMMQAFEVSMITSIYGAIIFCVGYGLYRSFQRLMNSGRA